MALSEVAGVGVPSGRRRLLVPMPTTDGEAVTRHDLRFQAGCGELISCPAKHVVGPFSTKTSSRPIPPILATLPCCFLQAPPQGQARRRNQASPRRRAKRRSLRECCRRGYHAARSRGDAFAPARQSVRRSQNHIGPALAPHVPAQALPHWSSDMVEGSEPVTGGTGSWTSVNAI